MGHCPLEWDACVGCHPLGERLQLPPAPVLPEQVKVPGCTSLSQPSCSPRINHDVKSSSGCSTCLEPCFSFFFAFWSAFDVPI